MDHHHFCPVAGHVWKCSGAAVRPGDQHPSVCLCKTCGLPLEQGGHTGCKNRIDLVACAEHLPEERRRTDEAKKEHERRAAEFGFDGKWARMKALPDGSEKHALAEEIVEWLFR